MRKKYLVFALVATMLLVNMPIASYATEAVEMVQEQQAEIEESAVEGELPVEGEQPDEEKQSVEKEQLNEEDLPYNDSDLATGESADVAETQENVESVSGNDGQDQDENNGGVVEQPPEIVPPESEDGTREEEVEIVQEHKDIVSEEATVGVGETGTYMPYEGAKYSLRYEVMDGGISIIGIADYVSKDDLGELVIPKEIEGVKVIDIDDYAFSDCSGFSGSLSIAEGVRTIGDYAFSGCSGFSGNLNIAEGVTTIGDLAFQNCNGLTGNLNIPDSVTKIGRYAFLNCSGFTGRLVIPSNVNTIEEEAFCGCSFDGLTIGMSNIPEGAFDRCEIVGTLTLQEGVVSIEERAFEYCNKFVGDLLIPGSVTEIGERAFFGCTFEDLIVGMVNIPDNIFNRDYSYTNGDTRGAFAGCDFTGKILLQNSVRTIGQNAFADVGEYRENKYSFGEFIIPDNVISIGDCAFQNCRGITELTIPSSVISIGNYAFKNCKGISELIIPDGVQEIGEGAFFGCASMRNIEIASSVKKIEKYAFNGISGAHVIKITILGKETIINDVGLGEGEGTFIWGYAGSTAEAYAGITRGCVFLPLDDMPQMMEYKVSTKQELIDAIGNNGERCSYRHIVLADGIYEIDRIYINNSAYVIIEAEHPGGAEILSGDGSQPVIGIARCVNISIKGCILGHKSVEDSSGCGLEGYVVNARKSLDVNIDSCDLYGCGITGINSYGCENVNLSNCVIRDCMRNITAGSANGLNISNCVISGNAYDNTYASTYAAMCCGGTTFLENCTFINNHSTTFKSPEAGEITLSNCSFHDNAWDNQPPKAYGICLNGITWQVDGDILKIGYPLQLDADTVIESKQGKVLDYSKYSLPWKKYKDLKIDVAAGVEYGLPQAATPIITQTGDRLTIKAADGCTIYYTTNGTVPTATTGIKADGSVVTLDCFSGTLRAIAVRPGYADSVVISRNFVDSDKNRNVVFDVNGVIGGRTVTFLHPDPNVKVYYSTTSSTITTRDKYVYAEQTVLFENFYGTVYARTYNNGVWGNVCRLILKIPVVNAPAISTDNKGNVTIRTSTPNSMIYYTTDGSVPTPANGTRVSGSSVTLPSFSGTLRAIAVRSCFTNSAVTSKNMINSDKNRNVTFSVKGVFGGRDVTFDCARPGAKIYYSSTTSRITTRDKCVNAGETVRFEDFYGTIYARSYCNGEWGNVCRLILKIPVAGTPTITIDNQGYATIQTATPDCYLYYTTDGSTPTMTNGRRVTASRTRVYVGRGVTVKAIAVRSCFTNSKVAEKK